MPSDEMNGSDTVPNNSKVIHFVTGTVCLGAIVCIATQAYCYITKVPDMNTPLSGAFLHVTDTLIGALIAMLINTRPAAQQKTDDKAPPVVVAPIPTPPAAAPGPVPVLVTNPPSDPANVQEQPPTPGGTQP